MSGKTVYIKMIAIIQIMAQIGCFVPASSAQLRMTDKIFSRIGFQDSLEQSASSFTVELREMDYIYSNLTSSSLVIMDELCRSANPQEGEKICWDFSEKLLNFIGIVDDKSFKSPPENESGEANETENRKNNTSLSVRGANSKLKDVSRPFIFLTTHFASLTKLADHFNNAINLHMLVELRIVDEKPRMEFKYKIRSGPTTIKNYGLALASCLRFPSSLIDRAEQLVDKVLDESLINIDKTNKTIASGDHEHNETTFVSQELPELERDVIDLFSYILLLMSSDQKQTSGISVGIVNQKLKCLIDKLSPEFREMIQKSTLEEVISVLNASRSS